MRLLRIPMVPSRNLRAGKVCSRIVLLDEPVSPVRTEIRHEPAGCVMVVHQFATNGVGIVDRAELHVPDSFFVGVADVTASVRAVQRVQQPRNRALRVSPGRQDLMYWMFELRPRLQATQRPIPESGDFLPVYQTSYLWSVLKID